MIQPSIPSSQCTMILLAYDGPMTRLRTKKKFKQALNSYLEHLMKMVNNGAFEDDNNTLKIVSLIEVKQA